MAQHIPIETISRQNYQKVDRSIRGLFKNGYAKITSSLKYREVLEVDYKEHVNDKVFLTSRKINEKSEVFEVHFNCKSGEITNIYLVS